MKTIYLNPETDALSRVTVIKTSGGATIDFIEKVIVTVVKVCETVVLPDLKTLKDL